jgi:hypothetical protein
MVSIRPTNDHSASARDILRWQILYQIMVRHNRTLPNNLVSQPSRSANRNFCGETQPLAFKEKKGSREFESGEIWGSCIMSPRICYTCISGLFQSTGCRSVDRPKFLARNHSSISELAPVCMYFSHCPGQCSPRKYG